MARIFISHSSENNELAAKVHEWLEANGWAGEVFLDLDPVRGIAAGERWKDALKRAAHRCEAVLALISPQWLASTWCKAEVDAARLLGKKVIMALIGVSESQVPLDARDEQWIDLLGDPKGYDRLREALRRAGLDPSSFSFPEGRRPYPGLHALTEEDAAIYFGREAQIVRALDKLRSLARNGVERLFLILGASGTGKSSFMRAGLLPRLAREDRLWVTLDTVRPERGIISGKQGLAQVLQNIMARPGIAAALAASDGLGGLPRRKWEVEEYLRGNDGALAEFVMAIRTAATISTVGEEKGPSPTVVLPIDQAEEILSDEGRDEAQRFLRLLQTTLEGQHDLIVLCAMRSDALPAFQSDAALGAIPKETFMLDTLPESSYRIVIEGPAALVRPSPIEIDPELTEALLADVRGNDALPLLAFTLERLLEESRGTGTLTLKAYDRLGRISGVIDTAIAAAFAEAAASGDVPRAPEAQIAIARRAFIPHLARVNADGNFARRIAALQDLPKDTHALIEHLANHRLIIKDRRQLGAADVDIVEVAHEALLHEWNSLKGWLNEEKKYLTWLSRFEQKEKDWREAADDKKRATLLNEFEVAELRNWIHLRSATLSDEQKLYVDASEASLATSRGKYYVAILLFPIFFAGLAVIFDVLVEVGTLHGEMASLSVRLLYYSFICLAMIIMIAQWERRRSASVL